MKKIVIILLVSMVSFFLVFDAMAADKGAIKKNVDGIVAGIDGGKQAADFKANDYKPYVFIMEKGGNLVVHPSLAGESLKEKAGLIYELLVKASPDSWIDYEWKGKQKHTYVNSTKSGLIVASGYSD